METRALFDCLSPLDHRYYVANRELFDRLGEHLSEHAMVRYCTRVEAALLSEHLAATNGEVDRYQRILNELPDRVDPNDVYEEEARTKHNIRSLVNVIKRELPDELLPYVHLGATSVDILDTANALRMRAAVREVVAPLLIELHREISHLAEEHASTVQVGRTHGQHGVPITFGFAMAEYVSRLGSSIEAIVRRSGELRGKMAGAVGAYNSLSLLTDDPRGFEERVLLRLGLQPAPHSTQLVEPEPLLRLLQELTTAFGIIANIADDLRHLQRSEIAEVAEYFDPQQVGSSTMPQKRNPWNCEHVKSLWKAFMPRVMTFYLDQISEHQRDLTNSASGRFVVEFVAGLVAAAARLKRVVASLGVNEARMAENARSRGSAVLAEAAYTMLAAQGHPDAHEAIRRLTLAAEADGDFAGHLKADESLWAMIRTQLEHTGLPEAFFDDPTHYIGLSRTRALDVTNEFRQRITAINKELSR